jgi:glutathione S-transferase
MQRSLDEERIVFALEPIDLGRGDQLAPEYLTLNRNGKLPTLKDGEFVLWQSNAILFYMAAKRPESGLWPSDLCGQADVLRWLPWESAHWDAESMGMVAYEKGSKAVLGLGAPDPAFIAGLGWVAEGADLRFLSHRSSPRAVPTES